MKMALLVSLLVACQMVHMVSSVGGIAGSKFANVGSKKANLGEQGDEDMGQASSSGDEEVPPPLPVLIDYARRNMINIIRRIHYNRTHGEPEPKRSRTADADPQAEGPVASSSGSAREVEVDQVVVPPRENATLDAHFGTAVCHIAVHVDGVGAATIDNTEQFVCGTDTALRVRAEPDPTSIGGEVMINWQETLEADTQELPK